MNENFSLKKILATYFIVVFGITSIIPGFDFFQWTKIKAMYVHYTEHALPDDKDYNLLAFLIQHIFDSDHLNKDHSSHQNLPISGQNQIGKAIAYFNISKFILQTDPNESQSYFPVFVHYSYNFIKGLFRPPR